MAGYGLICCVVNPGSASKALRVARQHGVHGGTITLGRGTVRSRLLRKLGFGEAPREIITMIVESELACQATAAIGQAMAFHKPRRGIIFSYRISDFIGSKNLVQDNLDPKKVRQSMHSVIYVVVDRGRAEDVIDSASKAGARGGTIMNGRGAGIHETQKLFSLDIEPEKEVVFVITESDLKSQIIEAVRRDLLIDQPGQGIIFALDVDEVYGLRED